MARGRRSRRQSDVPLSSSWEQAASTHVRVNRDVPEVLDEIVSHFEREGARVELTLHVEVRSDDGFDVPLVRTITENCRTLGITFEFNE